MTARFQVCSNKTHKKHIKRTTSNETLCRIRVTASWSIDDLSEGEPCKNCKSALQKNYGIGGWA